MHMITDPFHRAFTLIELLVVIGIIAILTAVLLGTFGGSVESARAAKCLSNMKSLANAVQGYHLANGKYPPAESDERAEPDVSGGRGNVKLSYTEDVGWISWYSKDLYPSESSQKSSCRTIGLYSEVVEDYQFALEHGALYRYLGGSSSVYVCPAHESKFPNAHWSYFMNPNYYDDPPKRTHISKPERTLLFAEIPFRGPGGWFPSGSGGSTETDAVIQFDAENIGFNHKIAKYWVAHVVFADGHVEKLRSASTGKAEDAGGGKGQGVSTGSNNFRKLTEWLCQGVDVVYDNGSYEPADGTEQ